MSAGPLSAYRERQRRGQLEHDPIQALAAEKLQSLWHALAGYVPAERTSRWRSRLGLARRPAEPAPQGLYIYGKVGRGKSMLMDLFFATVEGSHKRRVHFHEFMLEIHDAMHRLRKGTGQSRDPLPRIAHEIAAETWLLCFDEFQVDNIADAMILGRLFEALFDNGVVVVATSNTHPDDLYRDGLQRDRLLPFIAVLKGRLDVLELDARQDYRRSRLAGTPTYHVPLDRNAATALDDAFAALTDGAEIRPAELTVLGRTLRIPAAARGVARFSFDELCGQPLGSSDYLAIAKAYHTVILSAVPVLTLPQRNAARRLVTLIDALYEHRVMLLASAAAPPDALCPDSRIAPNFERTASRLIEMQSAEYIAQGIAG